MQFTAAVSALLLASASAFAPAVNVGRVSIYSNVVLCCVVVIHACLLVCIELNWLELNWIELRWIVSVLKGVKWVKARWGNASVTKLEDPIHRTELNWTELNWTYWDEAEILCGTKRNETEPSLFERFQRRSRDTISIAIVTLHDIMTWCKI